MDRPSVDDIAARDTARAGRHLRVEGAEQLVIGSGQVEREDPVREGRDDEHRPVRHDRRGLFALPCRGREVPGRPQPGHVGRRDLRQRTEARVGIVVRRHRPVARSGDGQRRRRGRERGCEQPPCEAHDPDGERHRAPDNGGEASQRKACAGGARSGLVQRLGSGTRSSAGTEPGARRRAASRAVSRRRLGPPPGPPSSADRVKN